MRTMLSKANDYLAQNRARRIWLRILFVLACIVVFCTTYALILPAITLEHPMCGLEEHTHTQSCYTQTSATATRTETRPVCTVESLGVHQHSPECYDEQGNLVCGYADYIVHKHTAECYDASGNLVCQLPEVEAHTHTDACYQTTEQPGHVHTAACYTRERGELVCGLAEGEGAHAHTEACYDAAGNLVCGLEESSGHVHTDACYAWNDVLTCTQSTDPVVTTVLTCDKPEIALHTHTQECYDPQTGELVCGQLEVREHVHDASCLQTTEVEIPADQPACGLAEDGTHTHTPLCYGTWELTCTLPEHTHTEACYADPEADVETAQEWEATLPKDAELTGYWAADVLAVAQSQLGYTESTLNFELAEDGETHQGYTRYGAWYGDPYGDWCAMFASFCLHYAGIPVEAMPQEESCPRWVETLSGEDWQLWHAAADYVPVPGDLVFFDNDQDGVADHVGIVATVAEPDEAGAVRIETIEGNAGDAVQRCSYDIASDIRILGYAELPENPEQNGSDQEQTVRTVEGDGYTVTVSYTAEAAIPENAELVATEYAKDSETYLSRYAEAAALYGWGEDQDMTQAVRLFNIGFFVDGVEVQPAAPVEVQVSYTGTAAETVDQAADAASDQPVLTEPTVTDASTDSVVDTQAVEADAQGVEQASDVAAQTEATDDAGAGSDSTSTSTSTYSVVHFGSAGTENVSAESSMVDGVQTVGFSLANFSDIALIDTGIAPLAVDPDNLDGQSFVLVNGAHNAAIVAEDYRVDGSTINRLKAQEVNLSDAEDGSRVARIINGASGIEADKLQWTFERDTSSRNVQYRIYAMVEGEKYYIQMGWDRSLSLTSWQNQATSFSLRESNNYPGQYRLYSSDIQNAINLYDGSVESGFAGYNDNGQNEYFYLATPQFVDAGTVEGVSPTGTVINVFDYWFTASQNDSDTSGDDNGGINAGHSLQFVNGGGTGINAYTNSSNPYTGIVCNTLENGYPVLSNGNGESLSYLFDTNDGPNKEVVSGATGLLQLSEDGYYYYNSQENYAELNTDNGEFTLYDTWGVFADGKSPDGQFFPFNSFNEVAMSGSGSSQVNHYFGLTLTTKFVLRHNGHTDSEENIPTVFEFSGDDDVWIFIDDVLVADLGGIHDAASVSINFATGDVYINGNNHHTLRDSFEDAGKDGEIAWSGDNGQGNSFADDTFHTLKFFYLERGGTDSNMHLSYNLSEYPSTSIVKVDQYGDPVPNATFALYRAQKSEGDSNYRYLADDGNYYMLKDFEESMGGESGEAWKIDETTGVITGHPNSSNPVTISPIIIGTSDAKGTITFTDEKGTPLALDELRTMWPDGHFILREVKTPEGYRQVSDEIWLYLQNGVLYCDSVYSSGVWASASVLINASQRIKLANGQNTDLLQGKYGFNSSDNTLTYFSINTEGTGDEATHTVQPNGTLFAVVLKRTGNSSLTNDKIDLTDGWAPVYGSDLAGFTVVDPDEDKNGEVTPAELLAASLVAAGYETTDGDEVAFTPAASNTMQLELTNLPGDVKTYYNYILREVNGDVTNGQLNDSEYAVAYFWSDCNGMSEVDAGNTYLVDFDYSNDAFERTYGATIEVPNLMNRMYVEKLDAGNNLIDGAVFALYNVVQSDDESVYYVADNGTSVILGADNEGDNEGVANVGGIMGTYTVNPANGVITATVNGLTYTISPAENANGDPLYGTTGVTGTGTYGPGNLKDGTYYLREIAAPEGFTLNTTEVMVRVTDNAIYANAGAPDDGVTVQRGAGYLAASMGQFASSDTIDNTLSWIYTKLMVSPESTSFADVDNRNNWTRSSETAYLKFDSESAVDRDYFNYVYDYDLVQTGELSYGEASDSARLTTAIGWSYLEIFQNTEYGITQTDPAKGGNGANYTELSEDISRLFSGGLYVQVTDQRNAITITKMAGDENGEVLSGAEFTLNYRDASDAEHFYSGTLTSTTEPASTYYDGSADNAWSEQSSNATHLVSQADGKINLKNMPNGVYTLTEVVAPDGYKLPSYTVTFTVENGVMVTASTSGGSSDGIRFDEEGRQAQNLIVYNSSGVELPNTGGPGTLLYTFGGLLLMAGASMCWLMVRRKGEGRAA